MKPASLLITHIVVLATLWLVPLGEVQGQVETILHTSADGTVTNDGFHPQSSVLGADGNIYYVTSNGGSTNYGAVWQMTPQGVVSVYYSFDPANNFYTPTSLIQAKDGTFYGTMSGPTSGVFQVTQAGQANLVFAFPSNVGFVGLVQGTDGNFYGTTQYGGTNNDGTFFQLTPQGAITYLHNFGDGSVTNDGTVPSANLIQGTDGNFYGSTYSGGSTVGQTSGYGTIFKITSAGTETILHNFRDGGIYYDGLNPQAPLIQATDGNFYGTTANGGSNGSGVVFKMTPAGTVTILHYFQDGSVFNDGANPQTVLVQGSDGNLYGTTSGGGGAAGQGTVYEITTQGGVTILHSFGDGSVANDGNNPNYNLVKGPGGIFYGTTYYGGSASQGTVFAIATGQVVLTGNTLPTGSATLPFSYQVTTAETATNFSATGLPAGLSINSSTGLITGAPTSVQTSTATITITTADGTSTVQLTITIGALQAPVVTSILTSSGQVGAAYTYSMAATNKPTSFSATGLASTGLTLNTATGVISGTPTSVGTFPVTLTAANSAGTSTSVTLSIKITSPPVLQSPDYVLHRLLDGSVPGEASNPRSLFQGLDGNFYYLTSGGSFNNGAVYRVTAQGSVSLFYSFNYSTNLYSPTSLIQGSDGNFYGTTTSQIFKLAPNGQATILCYFGTATPNGLIQGADGNFYGTTQTGGSNNEGTVFQITPQGAITYLHNFGDGSVTNDGANPYANLVQASNGSFYGTTNAGGSVGYGTVFRITSTGITTILHNFRDGSVANDGLTPQAPLIQGADSNFYGTTPDGGITSAGTAFKMTAAGTVTILHNFQDGSTLNDGSSPTYGLKQGSDHNFYGTTSAGGGQANDGTVYVMTPQGTVTTLHSFGDGSVANDGFNPSSTLIKGTDGNFYGTTSSGGDAVNGGTIYAIAPAPLFLASGYAASGTISVPFSYQVVTSYPPASYAATNLPAGLSIGSSTGLISGTPTTVQTKAVTLTVTTPAGGSTFPLTITIGAAPKPAITSVLVSYGAVASNFTYLTQATNNPASYSATGLASTGLSFDASTGIISGIPTTAGTFPITLTATNAAGTGSSVILSLQVSDSPIALTQEEILHRLQDGSVGNEAYNPFSLFQGGDGNFYYITNRGGNGVGNNGSGAIYQMTAQGSITPFFVFNPSSGLYFPTSLMQGKDGNFYGTTTNQVFKVTPSGQLSLLHYFTNISGLNGLIQGTDGNFYGTAASGGTSNTGAVFKITPQGAATILHNFGDGSVINDGSDPVARLVEGTDGNFYGTTYSGGSAGYGTVFQMAPQGSVTILHNFDDGSIYGDGMNPRAPVIQGADGNFYGTTLNGGTSGVGTIFSVTSDGALNILHSFGDGSTFDDGSNPYTGLFQASDGNFYGTTNNGGGASVGGAVYEMTPQGDVTILHSFNDGSVTNDGYYPLSSLIQGTDGNFYGTTSSGGDVANAGTIYVILPAAPVLTSGDNLNGSLTLPFSYQVTAENNPTHFAATGLPDGLSINSVNGLISGTPTTDGTYTVNLTLTNAGGSSSFSLTINVGDLQPPAITSILTAYASVGANFTYTTLASNQPTSYSASGLATAGLSIDTTTGIISGTPTKSGTFPVVLTATNAAGTGNQSILTIQITAAPVVLSEEYVVHRLLDGSVPGEGANPQALLQGYDGNFYYLTSGGNSSNGAIYQMTPQGNVTLYYSFNSSTDLYSPTTLIEAPNGTFYGTTSYQVFSLDLSGQITILHAFTGESGLSRLLMGADGNFYGTTGNGGTNNKGTVFEMSPQGAVTILHNFGDGSITNDGTTPQGGLIQGADGNFYGTTYSGGSAGYGTVFEITHQGTASILHNFSDGSVASDGSNPQAPLIQATDGNFYGTTPTGGIAGTGTVFKLTPQGSLTLLHSFQDGSTLNDGSNPTTGLIQGKDGNFYGTTPGGGGAPQRGTAFEITPQGALTILHSFNDGSVSNDGLNPSSGLIQGKDGNFYGTTSSGGDSNNGGTVYAIAPAVPFLTSPVAASGSVSLPFSYQVTATDTPTAYAATNLPAGLSINTTTGLISGTPTTVQTKTASLMLTNAAGSSSFALTVTIGALPAPAVTSILTAYGSVGTPFTYTILTSVAATSYTATNLSGTGLSLNTSTGVISGTPNGSGTIQVTLTATSTAGTGTMANLSILISQQPVTLNQEYNILHRFLDGSVANDGSNPQSFFQAFDGNFYYVTSAGGAFASGAVFKMTVQKKVSIYYSFNSASGLYSPTSLIQGADGNFYGTTYNQVFELTSTGQLSVLHAFGNLTNLNGLVQGADGNFYGTAYSGGANNEGAVFKITPLGVATILHNFGDGSIPNDGEYPVCSLVQGVDGNFYGTTKYGGFSSTPGGAYYYSYGTIFKITPTGSITILHDFNDGSVSGDGTIPVGTLIQATDGNFYGTTSGGGTNGGGTVFNITPQGTETILHTFGDGTVTNDGTNPQAGVIQGYDGNFYGTTFNGGSLANDGALYQITPQGAVTIIHGFGDGTVQNDGFNPLLGGVIQGSDGNFYGTTSAGGDSNNGGTVYAIVANQTPTHVPIFIGAAYESGPILNPFSFTPKVAFGVSGSGANLGSNSIAQTLFSMLPQIIVKAFSSATNWTLAGTLPTYLTFDPTSGTITGTPTQGGTFTLTMTPHNAIGSGTPQTVTLYIDVPPGISSPLSVTGTVSIPFTYQISALPAATSYGAAQLPRWLSADPVSGMISGTPPAAGTYVFQALATNVSGQTVQPVSLAVSGGSPTVPTITSTAAAGEVGNPLIFQIATSTAATSFSAANLPTGLLLDTTTGIIFGTPAAPGVFQVPVSATNAVGSFGSVLTVTITNPTVPSLVGTLTATALEGIPFTYQIPATGTVTYYIVTGLPTGLSVDTSTGIISGTPTVTGNFPVAITAGNDIASTNATLSLSVVVPAGFAQWATLNNVTGAPGDTPLHDGVPNLLKFLFDINPAVPISTADRAALPTESETTVAGTNYLTLTYRQYLAETGVTVTLESSPDLKTWQVVSPPDLAQQVGTDANTGDPIMQVGVKATGSAKQFIRLQVTQ